MHPDRLQAFLPLLRASSGRLVCTTSVSARVPTPGCSPYAAAKSAAASWAECAAVELRPFGVSVSLVEPGIYRTPLLNGRAQRDRVRAAFERLPPAVRADYGEQYLEKCEFPIAPSASTDRIFCVCAKCDRN